MQALQGRECERTLYRCRSWDSMCHVHCEPFHRDVKQTGSIKRMMQHVQRERKASYIKFISGEDFFPRSAWPFPASPYIVRTSRGASTDCENFFKLKARRCKGYHETTEARRMEDWH